MSLKRFWKRRRGVVTVEMAICLPILFSVVFFIFEFSRGMLLRRAMDDAAYEACRYVKVPVANHNEAESIVDEILQAVGANDYSVTVAPAVITDATDSVTVTVSAPMDSNILLTGSFFKGKVLTSSSTLKTERYRN